MTRLIEAFLHRLTGIGSKPAENDSTESIPSEWVLIGKCYAAPIPYPVVGHGLESEGSYSTTLTSHQIAQITLGVTTYIWQDQTTGDVKAIEILGKDVPLQPDEEPHIFDTIINSALTDGPQKFTVGGNEFLLGVVPKEDKLPIK